MCDLLLHCAYLQVLDTLLAQIHSPIWAEYMCDLLMHCAYLQVLDALLAQVQEHCSWLLEATMAPQSGLQSFNFLGNSILAAVDQQVSSSMPGSAPQDHGKNGNINVVNINMMILMKGKCQSHKRK